MAERRYIVTRGTTETPASLKSFLKPGAVFGGMRFRNAPASALPLLAKFGFHPEGNANRPATKRSPSKPSASKIAQQAANAARLARLKRDG